jgi:hypothetical protein
VSDAKPAQSVRTCSICKRPQDAAFRPFCSRRCADVDLQRWFSGAYAIPVMDNGDLEGDAPSSE